MPDRYLNWTKLEASTHGHEAYPALDALVWRIIDPNGPKKCGMEVARNRTVRDISSRSEIGITSQTASAKGR
ncbi:protein of unknown function [Methylocaldum szegediense]|uniref:Uncharacterized protein n=1 Tax=Methylocaldum szegediense TaxID=73780 RepID=A0ABM9HX95_9GAMM|nr:protein of unknown function [Methylocaldum szegediense]